MATWVTIRLDSDGAAPLYEVLHAQVFAPGPHSHEVHEFNVGMSQKTLREFNKVHVPANLRGAQRSDQWGYWAQAMQEEKDCLDAHDVMEYINRPYKSRYQEKVTLIHWIFLVKVDVKEMPLGLRQALRLVAYGCTQIWGIYIDKCFAPRGCFEARRAILSVAVAKDYGIQQVDIETAFLNGEFKEEVFVTQPPGYDNGDSNVVCRLKKAHCGLKHAPRAWHKTLHQRLHSMGYSPCKSDAGCTPRKGTVVLRILF